MYYNDLKNNDARKVAFDGYINFCLKLNKRKAKKLLEETSKYFKKNPSQKTRKVSVNDSTKEFLVALKILSAKNEYKIYVKPALFGKNIVFYSEWPICSDHEWFDLPIAYKITYKGIYKMYILEDYD